MMDCRDLAGTKRKQMKQMAFDPGKFFGEICSENLQS